MRLALPDEARYWHGEHDLDVASALIATVHEGSVVYDIGAHLGFFALGAARLAGESGRVVAFEGDPENATRLRENAAYNRLESRLEVVHAAVWSSSGASEIGFRRGHPLRATGGVESDGHRPVLGSAELIAVPVITLDEYIARGGSAPDVIKIDVQGGEGEVLRGGDRLFTNKTTCCHCGSSSYPGSGTDLFMSEPASLFRPLERAGNNLSATALRMAGRICDYAVGWRRWCGSVSRHFSARLSA